MQDNRVNMVHTGRARGREVEKKKMTMKKKTTKKKQMKFQT